eukprot:6179700-Pleurochrysis_carterae.AAC.2
MIEDGTSHPSTTVSNDNAAPWRRHGRLLSLNPTHAHMHQVHSTPLARVRGADTLARKEKRQNLTHCTRAL